MLIEGDALRAVEGEQVQEPFGHQQRDLAPALFEQPLPVGGDQLEDGQRIVEEQLLRQRHPLLAAVALELAVVLGDLDRLDGARLLERLDALPHPLEDRTGDPAGAAEDAETQLPGGHVVAGEEERIELGCVADLLGDRRHQLADDVLVLLVGSVEQGEEAELIVHG